MKRTDMVWLMQETYGYGLVDAWNVRIWFGWCMKRKDMVWLMQETYGYGLVDAWNVRIWFGWCMKRKDMHCVSNRRNCSCIFLMLYVRISKHRSAPAPATAPAPAPRFQYNVKSLHGNLQVLTVELVHWTDIQMVCKLSPDSVAYSVATHANVNACQANNIYTLQ